VGDEDYDSDEAAHLRHFNSQATSIILASFCREEYNKVQGFKSAKEIWDVLKMTHEGDEVHPQQRRRATSYVQPAQDHCESSPQPWEHQVG
jgi:predicted SAM-dependent methyltransferase